MNDARVSDAIWSLQNLPSDKDERDLVIGECHVVYAETRDDELLEMLAKTHMPFATRLAKRRHYLDVEAEELVCVASMGLTKALKAFEPSLGNMFTTFARSTINWHIQRYIRDVVPFIYAKRSIKELIDKVSGARRELTLEFQEEPTLAEIAERLQVELEDVEEAERAKQGYRAFSLDRLMDDTSEYLNLGRKDRNLERVEDRQELAPLFAILRHRDRQIVYLRVVDGLSQAEIGRIFGISGMQVSRVLNSALDSMRAAA